ncbi:hypothetical protein P8A18_09840 [Streptomyces castrisilvae]|uniref:Uncharacterized protein n=1 Tax=Streptomyces castrisilvae TaxID=3033811 RepID=A0ABY9HGS6_9ACTN|nr:hypothetical protein [Streptomyces sp. Mut1]WLQ33735.1 hypothetical protein P8A18_09840 [Streptomyces sp. Mut1]
MPAAVDARVEQIVRRTRRTHRANLPRRVPLKLLEGRGETPYDAALDRRAGRRGPGTWWGALLGLAVVRLVTTSGRSHARIICGRAAGKRVLTPPDCLLPK